MYYVGCVYILYFMPGVFAVSFIARYAREYENAVLIFWPLAGVAPQSRPPDPVPGSFLLSASGRAAAAPGVIDRPPVRQFSPLWPFNNFCGYFFQYTSKNACTVKINRFRRGCFLQRVNYCRSIINKITRLAFLCGRGGLLILFMGNLSA